MNRKAGKKLKKWLRKLAITLSIKKQSKNRKYYLYIVHRYHSYLLSTLGIKFLSLRTFEIKPGCQTSMLNLI